MRLIPFVSALLFSPLLLAATETISPTTQSDENSLTTTEQAQRWGLTSEEWSHYEQLKLGERGIWSPGLDPLTTLGIEATTDTKRQKYADLLVEKEYQRVEKELAFQRAYDAAWKRHFPELTPVAIGDSVQATSDNSRLAVFVRDNCAPCESRLKTLLHSPHPLDIYLVDSQNDDTRLRRWAVTQQIDIERVKKHDITLNHDAGRWLEIGQAKMPAVLEKQGAQWQSVTTP